MFKDNKIRFFVFLVAAVLFFIPFLWFRPGHYIVGGDDTRLYYVLFPWDWLKNLAIYSWFLPIGGGIGSYSPQFFYIPINFISVILGKVFFFFNSQAVWSGLIIAGSFIVVYLIIREFLLKERKQNYVFIVAIIGGLFYVFFPILTFVRWPYHCFEIFGLCGYPLTFLFFLRALRREKIIELFLGGVSTVIFSVAWMSIPNSLPWIILFFVFVFLNLIFVENKKLFFLKYLVIFIGISVVLNAFWLIPFVNSTFNGNAQVVAAISIEIKNAAVKHLYSMSTDISLISNLSGSGYFYLIPNGLLGKVVSFLFRDIYLGLIFFAIIGSALLIRLKKSNLRRQFIILVIIFLTSAYLITVQIGDWGPKIFSWLMYNIPGFTSLRGFEVKLIYSFCFWYSITFALSLYILLSFLKSRILKMVFIVLVLGFVIIQSTPFISGQSLSHTVFYGKSNSELGRRVQIPKSYLELMSYLKNIPEDFRVTSFPFAVGSWTMFLSDDEKGVYIGSSIVRIAANKGDVNSQFSFQDPNIPELEELVRNALKNNNYSLLRVIFSILNVRYVINNPDIYSQSIADLDKIRENKLWGYTPDSRQRYLNLVVNLPVKLDQVFGSWSLYKMEDNFFLPHIYAPGKLFYLGNDLSSINEALAFRGFSISDGFVLESSKNDLSFFENKINNYIIPIKNKINLMKELQTKIDQFVASEDYKQEQYYRNLLSLCQEKVLLDDNYSLKILQEGDYRIYIKKSSLISQNNNLWLVLDDLPINKGGQLIRAEEPNWLCFNQVHLTAGEHRLELYNNNERIESINPSDIVFKSNFDINQEGLPKIEFKKINLIKYRVNISGVKESFPLFFLEAFNKKWKLYLDDQLVSDRGDKFVSSEIAGSIQNDNLVAGTFYETYNHRPVLGSNHFIANGYANGWWIDLNQLEQQRLVTKDQNGNYNLSLIIEFEPQRYFYLGILISILGLLSLIIVGLLGYKKCRDKKNQN